MSQLNWCQEYSVNNKELDEHHKTLFGILNKLDDNCKEAVSAECLNPVIDKLIYYTNYHFTAEINHMTAIGYKDIDSHINEHRCFTEKVMELQQLAGKSGPEATQELVKYLSNWLLHHVVEVDRKYVV